MTTAETFGIVVPQTWHDIPLREPGFTSWRSTSQQRLREAGGTPTDLRALDLLLTQLRVQMLETGVQQAAGTQMLLEGGAGESQLLAASMVLFVQSTSQLGATGPITAPMILQSVVRFDGGGPLELRRPRTLSHPAGPAVRLERLHRGGDTNSGLPNRTYAHTTLVPYDHGTKLLTLQLATINDELHDQYRGLFDRIAETVRIFYPGDPTEFAAENEP